MPSDSEADEVGRSVAIDLYCGDDRMESLMLDEGESFDGEIHCSDFSMEVRYIVTETDQ